MEILHEAPTVPCTFEEYSSTTPLSLSDTPELLYLFLTIARVSFSSPLGGLTQDDKADVYITSTRVAIFQQDLSQGVALSYKNIVMHGIQKGNSTARGCVYLQLEGIANEDIVELRWTPSEEQDLQNIFEALSSCSSLNPDAQTEQEIDGGWITADNFKDSEEEQNGDKRRKIEE
jgi:hypothetical protein